MKVDGGEDGGRVTIRDVADVAEVHISTVSRALDPAKRELLAPDTRARVLAVAEELGYRPHLVASGLRRGQTRTVGLVIPDLGNPIYAPLTRGVTHALDGGGYMPLVSDTEDDRGRLSRVLHHLAQRRVEAVIVTAARLADEDLLREVAEGGTPVVTAVRTVPASGLPVVFHDDARGAALAAEHLVALGHRRLGQIRGPQDVEPFRARTRGFVDAVASSGADLVPDRPAAPRPTVEDGHRIATELLTRRRGRPTGIFVQNDTLAIGALQAVRELDLRCPEHVSVVGYNDDPYAAHTDPPLTTIRLEPYEIGRQAGRLALAAIERREHGPDDAHVPPELVVRSTTGPVAAEVVR